LLASFGSAQFDTNKNGTLSRLELKEACKVLGMSLDHRESMEILKKYDADGNGKLDLREFNYLVHEVFASQLQLDDEVPDMVVKAFNRFDTNKSGRLSKGELREALKQLWVHADSEDPEYVKQTQAIMAKYDVNANGTLELREFHRLLKEIVTVQAPGITTRSAGRTTTSQTASTATTSSAGYATASSGGSATASSGLASADLLGWWKLKPREETGKSSWNVRDKPKGEIIGRLDPGDVREVTDDLGDGWVKLAAGGVLRLYNLGDPSDKIAFARVSPPPKPLS